MRSHISCNMYRQLSPTYDSPCDIRRLTRDGTSAQTWNDLGFRFYRRKSLGRGFWLGFSKSGPSFGRRAKPVSASLGGRGIGGSLRLMKGLSYAFRKKR